MSKDASKGPGRQQNDSGEPYAAFWGTALGLMAHAIET